MNTFAKENKKTREYYNQDFSQINVLFARIRNSLFTGEKFDISDLNLKNLIDYNPENLLYITIFEEFKKNIRFGSKRETLEETIQRVILKLREKSSFKEYDISNPKKTRILLEWIYEKTPVNIKKIHTKPIFDKERFEPGITGIQADKGKEIVSWLPTDSPINNEMTLSPALIYLSKKLKLTENKATSKEKIDAIKNLKGVNFYLTKSRAFISYSDKAIPLYRGNLLHKGFSYQTVLEIFKTSNDWLIQNMKENGQFTYYYNCTDDNYIDHEHPKRKEPNLYYNDLRHCGGVISLLRMYELTQDEKYLNCIKKAIDWIIGITKFHTTKNNKEAAYVFANEKAKLGGVGIPLIMLMRYRLNTQDENYDRYIEAYSRHLISRISDDGEFMGYYIHPSYQNGKPLEDMSAKEKKETFSFYYPGEALMGLAMVANYYNKNQELKDEIIINSKKAMRWIIDERPKKYKDYFTSLPSDAWLMQAIEEWANQNNFLEKNDIDFVFNDAKIMIEKTYQKDDSPYIDFEGGMYYEYGDHYYPDGARCEGLISAYYLAKKLKKEKLAQTILENAKKAAMCQFQLQINKYNNYAHKNPKKSQNSIKFKSTRQWIRVDSIQHVACFFIRLYWAENKSFELNLIK